VKPANDFENRSDRLFRSAKGENKGENAYAYQPGSCVGKRAPVSHNSFVVPSNCGRQSDSLLGQAKEWEHRALTELESYFMADTADFEQTPQLAASALTRWDMMAAA